MIQIRVDTERIFLPALQLCGHSPTANRTPTWDFNVLLDAASHPCWGKARVGTRSRPHPMSLRGMVPGPTPSKFGGVGKARVSHHKRPALFRLRESHATCNPSWVAGCMRGPRTERSRNMTSQRKRTRGDDYFLGPLGCLRVLCSHALQEGYAMGWIGWLHYSRHYS